MAHAIKTKTNGTNSTFLYSVFFFINKIRTSVLVETVEVTDQLLKEKKETKENLVYTPIVVFKYQGWYG